MTKALYRKIDTRLSWGSVLSLDTDSIEELKLNSWSPLFNSQLPTRLVYSDASESACAAHISVDGTRPRVL